MTSEMELSEVLDNLGNVIEETGRFLIETFYKRKISSLFYFISLTKTGGTLGLASDDALLVIVNR